MTHPDNGDSDDAEQSRPSTDEPENKLDAHAVLDQMGGVSGLIYSSLPVLVFVPVSSLFGLSARDRRGARRGRR